MNFNQNLRLSAKICGSKICQNYININVLNISLEYVSGEATQLDVFRGLLIIAKSFNNKNFDEVFIQYKGKDRFILAGTYFKKLVIEYGQQNPLYTIRTFPENVISLGRFQLYDSWTGGILAVTKKQMDAFNDLNQRWYLNEGK